MNTRFGIVLVLALCLSLVSAIPHATNAQPLSQSVEVRTVGGVNTACYRSLGLEAAFLVGSFSPCGVLCLAGGWYNLILIGAYC